MEEQLVAALAGGGYAVVGPAVASSAASYHPVLVFVLNLLSTVLHRWQPLDHVAEDELS